MKSLNDTSKVAETCVKKLQDLLKTKLIEKPRISRAPGRINLIGEHTDYNEGYVFPNTISKDMIIAAVPNSDNNVKIHSLNFNETRSFFLKDFTLDGSWIDYAKGVVHFLQQENHDIHGFTATCFTDIPIGGGLSSSAAFEVAVAHTFKLLNELKIRPRDLALIAYKGENQYMNISCGIMDQFISVMGKHNNALFLDCRPPYHFELVPLPLKDHKIVIFNTMIRHSVKDFINLRKQECFNGVKQLQKYLPGIKTLRDVSPDDFKNFGNNLPPPIRNRCEHVIRENHRVLDAINFLKGGNMTAFGELLYASHESLRRLYEVSCPELDFIVDYLKIKEGVVGGRLTGAGMGGSAFAIVNDSRIQLINRSIKKEYKRMFKRELEIYNCEIPNGVEELRFEFNYDP